MPQHRPFSTWIAEPRRPRSWCVPLLFWLGTHFGRLETTVMQPV